MRHPTGFTGTAGIALAVALVCLLALPAVALAVTGGPVIPVNTTTDGYQRSPVITADETGGFTVAWQSWPDVAAGDQSASKYDVYARRFDASGAPLGGEIPVNTTTLGSQEEPAITGDGSGGFIIAWVDRQPNGPGLESSVRVRRFSVTGQPLSDEINVSTTQTGFEYSPAIARDDDGDFTIAWESVEGGSLYQIFLRRFDSSGAPLGDQFKANTPGPTKLDSPDIASTDDGGFAVTWVGRDLQETRAVVFVRQFDATGAPTCKKRKEEERKGEEPIDTCPEAPANASFARQNRPAIAALAGGGFEVSWMGEVNDGIYARRFNAEGVAPNGPIRVDPPGQDSVSGPAVAADPEGGFAVAWLGNEAPGSPVRVFGRRFGNATDAVPIDPGTGFPDQPAIVAYGDGGFAVAWVRQVDLDQGGQDVFARRFVGIPETRIDTAPPPLTNEINPSFDFSSDEGAEFECRLDDGEFSKCEPPLRLVSLPDGPHTFEVRAKNLGGTDQSPAASSFTVDTVGPDGEIDSGPSGLIDESSPTFTFSSDDPDFSTFECKLDLDPYAPCASPIILGPLIDGPHTFTVRARDKAGNFDLTLAVREFAIDTHPPTVSILSGPQDATTINNATPTFDFDANEVVTFDCRIDGGPAETCGSPYTTAPLADGPHVFSVTGTDLVGHSASASREFTIDTTAPETEIASGPTGPISNSTPTFAFEADDPGAAFECRVDEAPFQACVSPSTTHALLDGPHAFSVRAADEIGNADPTPAIRSFTVDTVAPDTSIASGPSSLTSDSTPTFAFGSSEPGSTYECRLDEGAFAPCGPPFASAHLLDGFHSFDVRAIDQASNTDASPASDGFTVDTKPPSTTIRAGKGQRLGKPIKVTVSCAEDCTVHAAGRVSVRPGGTFRLRAVTRQLSAGGRATVRLDLAGAKAESPKGNSGRAMLTLTFTDRAGNSKTEHLRVALGAS